MKTQHPHDVDCNALIAQIWDYLDEELSAERALALEAHLAACSQCSGRVEFERTVLTAIRQAQYESLNTERLTIRVRSALAAAGLSDPR